MLKCDGECRTRTMGRVPDEGRTRDLDDRRAERAVPVFNGELRQITVNYGEKICLPSQKAPVAREKAHSNTAPDFSDMSGRKAPPPSPL